MMGGIFISEMLKLALFCSLFASTFEQQTNEGHHSQQKSDEGKGSFHFVQKWTKTLLNKEVVVSTISKNVHEKYEMLIDFSSSRPCQDKHRPDISFHSGSLSTLNTTDSLIRNGYGPDEIVVQIEGRELRAHIAKLIGCHKYRVNFHLLHTGIYHIKAVQLRSNYSALDETLDAFPLMGYEYLVSDWLELSGAFRTTNSTTSTTSTTTCHTPLHMVHSHSSSSSRFETGVWVETASLTHNESLSAFSSEALHTSSGLSTQDLGSKIPPIPQKATSKDDNRQLPMLTSFAPLSDQHVADGCASVMDRYVWAFPLALTAAHNEHCTSAASSSSASASNHVGSGVGTGFGGDGADSTGSNRTAGSSSGSGGTITSSIAAGNKQYNSTEAANILKGKTIQISGDSHTRILTNLLLQWACQLHPRDLFPKIVQKTVTVASDAALCAGLSIQYRPNYFCDLLPQVKPPPDLVIMNCGQHPASSEHMPFADYMALLTRQIQSHRDNPGLGYSPKNFLWMETTPQPLRQDHWVIDVKDWRTQHRLTLFNDHANNLFRHYEYNIISTYHILLPFLDSGCDLAHYTASGMLYPIFQQILAHLERISQQKQHTA